MLMMMSVVIVHVDCETVRACGLAMIASHGYALPIIPCASMSQEHAHKVCLHAESDAEGV